MMKKDELKNRMITLLLVLVGNVIYALTVKLFLISSDCLNNLRAKTFPMMNLPTQRLIILTSV